MKVLVTGAGGFIGSHAVRALIAGGHEVHACVRGSAGMPEGLAQCADDLVLWPLELDDDEAVSDMVERVRPEAALHLAWYSGPRRLADAAGNRASLEVTAGLVRSLSRNGCRRLVTAGTCLETQPPAAPAGMTPYAHAKREAHKLVVDSGGGRMRSACAHIFSAFGPFEAPSRAVPTVVRSLLAGRPCQVSAGTQLRDVLYAGDVGAGLAALVGSDVTGAVDVCSGVPRTQREVFEAFEREVGATGLLRHGEAALAPEELFDAVGDPEPLRRLGWEAAVSFDEAVSRTVRWWSEQR